MRSFAWIAALICASAALGALPPRMDDSQFELTVFAEQPDIWTPTGIAVDEFGRIFVIESNTHLPKKDYPGPKTDRIKVFTENDGKMASSAIFAEGLSMAMNLAFATNGDLFVVQRNSVIVLRDKDRDGKAEAPQTILSLETRGDFPHNGFDGLAIGPDGWIYVGMGENLGLEFTIKGKGGPILHGDQGGHIFRCRMDGSTPERFATGFWNPYSLAFDELGNLFAMDNDPDGRPPCRILHIIRGGNYGYQFK